VVDSVFHVMVGVAVDSSVRAVPLYGEGKHTGDREEDTGII